MSGFRMTCIDNRMRDITKLEDNYSKVKNIPQLLICNQNNIERKRNVDNLKKVNSVLLKDIDIDKTFSNLYKNQNNALYSRNIPSGDNIPINIDMRPLPSSYCLDKRFEEDQKSLANYNKYIPSIDCDNNMFIPNKGSVKGYFDNIDIDSQLKNINEIDTKCSKKLFKIDPNSKKTKLSCYKDSITNNYNRLDCKNGYTWCNYNKCSKLQEFQYVIKKNLNVFITEKEKEILKLKEKIKIQEGEEIEEQNKVKRKKLEDYKNTIELLDKKRLLETNYEIEENSNPNLKPYNIVQYNNGSPTASNEVSNIYAPIINKREFKTKNIEQIGYKKGLRKNIDKKINENLNYYRKMENQKKKQIKEKIDQYKLLDAYCPNNIESVYIDKYYQKIIYIILLVEDK